MGMGRVFDGVGDSVEWNNDAGEICGRYGTWMCWIEPYLTTAADYFISIQAGIAMYRQGSGEITAEWRINGTTILCESAIVPDDQWYHCATWYDHTANTVNLRVYDHTAGTTTTYTSASLTPSTWNLETVANDLFVGARNTGINLWVGEVSSVKIWKAPDTASQLTEAEIDREKYTWWPQTHPEYCVVVAPLGTGSPEKSTGTHTDSSGTITGDPGISNTGPPLLAQVMPNIMRPQSKARHVRL